MIYQPAITAKAFVGGIPALYDVGFGNSRFYPKYSINKHAQLVLKN